MTTPSSSDGPSASAVQAPSGSCGAPGAVIGGRYTLRDPIGAGGMGAVWRAHDDLLRRDVAIKEVLLPPGIPAEERDAVCERTLREARAAAGLSHPSVVQVYDVITHNDRPWIVMELLNARSVADMISRNGSLPPRAIAKIGLSVLGALSAAHTRGVLHRDVKPANVLICSDGRCVLTDFGVARIMADNAAALTTPGMVLGSPQYISPERATGSEFGPPSDLFSLGVTLYTAAEGKPPFDRGDPLATMHAVVYEEPTPPRNAGPLTPILMGLLIKDPKQRWDVQRTRDELRAVLAGPLSADASQVSQQQSTQSQSGAPAPLWPARGGTNQPQLPAQPMPAQQPMSTQPMSAQPMSAQSARPVSAQPMSAQPMSGQPMAPPTTMRASAAVPQPPSQGYYDTGYPDPGYSADAYGPPRQSRGAGPWLLAAAAAAIVLILIVVVVGATSGWFGAGNSGGKANQTSSEHHITGTPIKDPDGRFSSAVPKGWKLVTKKEYLQYADPKSADAWIRFSVAPSGSNAANFLNAAGNGLSQSSDYSNFRRIALRHNTKLAGKTGAELEYTLVRNQDGQLRHALWRAIVVGGKAYQVYMSVPQSMFKSERPAYRNAVQAYALH